MFTMFGREATLSFDKNFQSELAKESWTMYALGMLFIGLRTYARIRRNGIRSLCPDDYLMLVAAAWYTMLIVCLNVISGGGGSNLYPPEQFSTFSQQEIKERIKGSKIVVVSEQSMLNLIYTLKACMLFIYTRLTVQLKHQIFVKALAIYVAAGYVGTQLAFFLACRPFSGYWAMPPPNPQCTTLEHYAIAQACFNISSDFFMLVIVLPLLISTTLPLKQKIVLIAIFGMGLFVIFAAILTKVFNLADVYSTVYMLWYVRESSVAVWVTNLPLIWPLLRETFPMLKSFTPGHRGGYSRSRSRSKRHGGNAGYGHGGTGSVLPVTTPGIGVIGVKTSTHVSVRDRGFQMDVLRKKRGDSSISLDSDERELNAKYPGDNMGGISTETTVEVDQRTVGDTEDGRGQAWGHDHGYHVDIHGGERGDSVAEGADPVEGRRSGP